MEPKKTEPQRIKVTAFISLEAYDAITTLQHRYRRETSKALPLWKIIDAAIIAYARQGTRNAGDRCESFMTIDDVRRMAQELLAALDTLGSYKYPLDIRRGVGKGVGDMAYAEESKMVKSSTRTYFFDIKKTQEGKPYLVITESRKKENARSSMMVFPEDADSFFAALEEMIKKL